MPNINFPRSIARIFLNPVQASSSSGCRPHFIDIAKTRRNRQEDQLMRKIKMIEIKGLGDRVGLTVLPNEFKVKMGHLDYMKLFLEVQGPGYVVLNHQAVKDQKGVTVVYFTYKVQLPGVYNFNVKYSGIPVTGSPFLVTVKKIQVIPFSCYPSKSIVAHGKGLRIAKKGAVSSFKVNTSKVAKSGDGPLMVLIDCPDGTTMSPFEYQPGRYGCKVDFICANEGMHIIHVKWDGHHIQGSPFEVRCVARPFSYPDLSEALQTATSIQVHFGADSEDSEIAKKIGIVSINDED